MKAYLNHVSPIAQPVHALQIETNLDGEFDFRQPEKGLGNDNTPSSHMWRTLRHPCNTL